MNLSIIITKSLKYNKRYYPAPFKMYGTEPQHNEPTSLVPCHFVKSRFHYSCTSLIWEMKEVLYGQINKPQENSQQRTLLTMHINCNNVTYITMIINVESCPHTIIKLVWDISSILREYRYIHLIGWLESGYTTHLNIM